MIKLLLFTIFTSIYIDSAVAQQVAFPGAEGAGRFTTGGRGTATIPTTVFEVTHLNDDNSPGSLRYAVTQAAPYRTVVFRVSGTIHLTSPLRFTRANTTIAGQTAPGDGICIADHPTIISADNVIVRYMRFRMGDKNQNKGMVNGSGADDTFGALDRKHIIVDHCSMSWSSDEACTIYRGDSTTLQWNIISEPLNYSYHFETGDTDFERHGYGGIWGGRKSSFHHNLIAHCLGRTPRFDGSRNLAPNTPGQENADFRNNVIYNWGSYNVNGGEGGNYNIVNNYYKYGPSTSSGSSVSVPIRYEIINPGKTTSAPILPYGKYYLSGNYVDGSAIQTNNNWRGAAMSGGTFADTALAKVDVPFDMGPVTTQTAEQAYELVLAQAGVSLPKRDTLDERIVNDVKDRSGRIIDVQGGYPHGTPYPETVNAWPALISITPPLDTDHDGMPDDWETARGLNPNNAGDRSLYDANGFTNLENYLNSIAHAPVIQAPLPLRLLSFNGISERNQVRLSWQTSNEENTDHFLVEKSNDRLHYLTIGKLVSKNTAALHQYVFIDPSPSTGKTFYRLKLLDRDGSFTYSDIVLVNGTPITTAIRPNPAQQIVIVSHPPASSSSKIVLYQPGGAQLAVYKLIPASVETIINVASLPKGRYLLAVDKTASLQFIKE